MIGRRALVGGLVGVAIAGAVGVAAQDGAAPSTRWAPQAIPPGITIEPLANLRADLGNGPPQPGSPTVALDRITYAVGATLDLHYAGPVLYYVESGTLGVPRSPERMGHLVFSHTSTGGGSSSALGPGAFQDGETLVPAGYAVSADDGYLGQTRNAGNGPLVVLAMLYVPRQPGMATSQLTRVAVPVPGSRPATPMPGK